jgi:single-strand DNA-binding protein
MSSLNRVYLAGNLTRDPQLKETAGGLAVADLGVAVNERYRTAGGEQQERTVFADVVVWGKQAQACAQYLRRGAPVLVEGSLQLDRWETSTGEKRSRMRVRALRVQFLGRASAESGGADPGAAVPEPVGAGAGRDEAGDMPF